MNRFGSYECSKCGYPIVKGASIHTIEGVFHEYPCYEEFKKELIDNYEWEEYKTSDEDILICPYCGYDEQEYEGYWEPDNGHGTMECERCERVYVYTREVSVLYSTRPLEDGKKDE